MSIEGKNFEECSENRYLFRYSISNPMQKFVLQFLEIRDNLMHVSASGIATIDYDEDPMITVDFELDSYVAIKID